MSNTQNPSQATALNIKVSVQCVGTFVLHDTLPLLHSLIDILISLMIPLLIPLLQQQLLHHIW